MPGSVTVLIESVRLIGDYVAVRWIEILGALAAILAAWNSHLILRYQRPDTAPLFTILEKGPVDGAPGHFELRLSIRNRLPHAIRLTGIECRRPSGLKIAMQQSFAPENPWDEVEISAAVVADPNDQFARKMDMNLPMFSIGSTASESGHGGDAVFLPLYLRALSSKASAKLSMRFSFSAMDAAQRTITKDITITAPAQTNTIKL